MTELLGWLEAGKLKPHLSGRYPLARAAEALVALASRKVAGKLVVEPEA
jgi:NADPH2:quinone reductase